MIILTCHPKKLIFFSFSAPQVGIPVAAGVLLPVTGTMLTPSIAGALMGLSSIGVMTNSLLLRFKYAPREKEIGGPTLQIEIPLDSDSTVDEEKKLKDPLYPLDNKNRGS